MEPLLIEQLTIFEWWMKTFFKWQPKIYIWTTTKNIWSPKSIWPKIICHPNLVVGSSVEIELLSIKKLKIFGVTNQFGHLILDHQTK